jgi:hypothetical protein
MRAALVLFIALHAGLHLLGFLKPWNLASLPQLTGRTVIPISDAMGRAIGVLWLLATVTLLVVAALLATRNELWWLAGIGGVGLSQALIVLQWPDAKLGTVANLLIAIAVVVATATHRFKGEVNDEVRGVLAAGTRGDRALVRAVDLKPLPPPVRAWLVRSGVVGKARARTVRLRQRGEMRTSPEQAWMPARAEQYFTIDPPAFVWSVDVTMFHVIPVVGRDSYLGGRGHMLIKAASLVNVVDATGPKIDQGTLLRYLAEIMWFPSAALSRHITWQAVDRSTARATLSYGGVSASALFVFDEHGRCSGLRAKRYMGSGDAATLEEWAGTTSRWRVVRGVEIPVSGEVIWQLGAGDFSYYRWEIDDVEYDVSAPYDSAADFSARSARSFTPSSMRRSIAKPTGSISVGTNASRVARSSEQEAR